MNHAGTQVCTVCEGAESKRKDWFLLAESRWHDRLKVLRWNDRLATQQGVHCACSAMHVQELVVHWMTAGSLDYPFAHVLPTRSRTAVRRVPLPCPEEDNREVDTSAGRLIGELAVDRGSILRVLRENPQALSTILEALLGALQRETRHKQPKPESEDLEVCAASYEI